MESIRADLALQNSKASKQFHQSENISTNSKIADGEIFDGSFDTLRYEHKQQRYDNSLKKNNAFIKKMKIPITKANYESILKDISELSLEKYLPEIINTYLEALQNIKSVKDIAPNIQVISALHQRFAYKFTQYIRYFLLKQIYDNQIDYISKSLVSNMKYGFPDYSQIETPENISKLSKLKVYLKFFIECYLVKLFDILDFDLLQEYPSFVTPAKNDSDNSKISLDGDLIVFEVIRLMIYRDLNLGSTSSIILGFLKEYGEILSNKIFVSENMVIRFKSLMEKFNTFLLRSLKDLEENIKKVKSQNSKSSIKKGAVDENREKNERTYIEVFENYVEIHKILCRIFCFEEVRFTLIEGAEKETFEYVRNEETRKVSVDGVVIWENIEEYEFYTNIEDVTDYIPELLETIKNDENDSSRVKADQMSLFIQNLLECSTSEKLLELSINFWNWGLMNKASYNRLLTLFTSTKDTNKSKYFARFLAVNRKLLGDFIEDLALRLGTSLRFMIQENSITDKRILNTNMKSFYFFLELIRFKLIPMHQIFFTFRILILTIGPRKLNIELLNIFFDKVGRFLYYCCGSEYRALMDEMMELLETQSSDKNSSINDRFAVKYFNDILHPPVSPFSSFTYMDEEDSVAPFLNPQQVFIRRLILKDLNPNNWHKVIFCILQLNPGLPENFFFLVSIFTKPEKLKFENIELLAKMLVIIRRTASKDFFIYVVDSLLECLQSSMEFIDFQYNRKRVTRTQYLAEIICLMTNDPTIDKKIEEKADEKYLLEKQKYSKGETLPPRIYRPIIDLKTRLTNVDISESDFVYDEESELCIHELIMSLRDENANHKSNYIEQNVSQENRMKVYKILKQKILNLEASDNANKMKLSRGSVESFESKYFIKNDNQYDNPEKIRNFARILFRLGMGSQDTLRQDISRLSPERLLIQSNLPVEEKEQEKDIESQVDNIIEVTMEESLYLKRTRLSKRFEKNAKCSKKFPRSCRDFLNIFFKMGFLLVGYGYPAPGPNLPNIPPPGFRNDLDPRDDFRRVNLLLILLETTINHGDFFQTFSIKCGSHKYDNVITNIQWKGYRRKYLLLIACLNYYIEMKEKPLPTDITFKANNFFKMLKKCGFYHYSNDVHYILKTYFKIEVTQPHQINLYKDEAQEQQDSEGSEPEDLEEQLEKELQDQLEKEFDGVLQDMVQDENVVSGNFDYNNNKSAESKINMLLDSKFTKESLNVNLGKVNLKLVTRAKGSNQVNVKPISVSLDNDVFNDKVAELNRKLEEEDILKRKTLQSSYY